MLAAKFCPDPNPAATMPLTNHSSLVPIVVFRYVELHDSLMRLLWYGTDTRGTEPVTRCKFGRFCFSAVGAMSWSIWPLHAPTSWWRGVWPLFCETDRVVDCFTSGRFLWRSDAQKWPRPVGASRRLCHTILPQPAA